jgi:hypothetical protein
MTPALWPPGQPDERNEEKTGKVATRRTHAGTHRAQRNHAPTHARTHSRTSTLSGAQTMLQQRTPARAQARSHAPMLSRYAHILSHQTFSSTPAALNVRNTPASWYSVVMPAACSFSAVFAPTPFIVWQWQKKNQQPAASAHEQRQRHRAEQQQQQGPQIRGRANSPRGHATRRSGQTWPRPPPCGGASRTSARHVRTGDVREGGVPVGCEERGLCVLRNHRLGAVERHGCWGGLGGARQKKNTKGGPR